MPLPGEIRILQIVPAMLPDMCGVGDYALTLAKGLKKHHSIQSTFLAARRGPSSSCSIDGFDVQALQQVSSKDLACRIDAAAADVVLLHYSGYGYHKRGIPLELVRGIRKCHLPIITMFHELYATGAITTSSFWLSPLMKVLARKLAKLSSARITNRRASADWIGQSTEVVPIASSMGELPEPIPFERRKNAMAIFAYQASTDTSYWRNLTRSVEFLRPDEIVCLGRTSEGVDAAFSQVPVRYCGMLPNEEIGQTLQQCRYGFASYDPAFLGKSSILAAFLAHGLCTVLSSDKTLPPSEGLTFGTHLLDPGQLAPGNNLEAIGIAGFNWYQSHSQQATAGLYANKIEATARAHSNL